MATAKELENMRLAVEAERATAARMTNTELNSIETSEEALTRLSLEWGLTAEDLLIGDEYPLVADKDELVGVPLFLVQWKFGVSQNFGSEYVQAKAVRLDTNAKIGIFDSGVGIYGALAELTDKRIADGKPAYNGAAIRGGLTKSEYPPKFDESTGEMIRPAGKTYYFA